MKKILYTAAMLGLFACNNANTPSNEGQTSSSDTTKNAQGNIPSIALTGQKSLDVLGTFMADYPCTDCKLNKVILTITNSGNAMYREKKIGKADDKGISTEGKWAFNADSTIISITPKEGSNGQARSFRYSSGTFIQLDASGNPVTCENGDCTLKKVQPVKVSNSKASGKGSITQPSKQPVAKTPLKADPSTNK
jgi:uncharacterized lipoprotein NlpE involved in copper resistance